MTEEYAREIHAHDVHAYEARSYEMYAPVGAVTDPTRPDPCHPGSSVIEQVPSSTRPLDICMPRLNWESSELGEGGIVTEERNAAVLV